MPKKIKDSIAIAKKLQDNQLDRFRKISFILLAITLLLSISQIALQYAYFDSFKNIYVFIISGLVKRPCASLTLHSQSSGC